MKPTAKRPKLETGAQPCSSFVPLPATAAAAAAESGSAVESTVS